MAFFCGLLLLLNSSCHSNKEEIIEISAIKISNSEEENKKVGKDLTSFNFIELIKNKLLITDDKTLSQISWQFAKAESSNEIVFQLILKEDALKRKIDLQNLFKNFIDKKLVEYKNSIHEIDEVEVMAEYYMNLIETSTIDTIWLKTSATLKKYASKDDFHLSIKQRKKLFKPIGERRIDNRKISTELADDTKGLFYTISFLYANNEREEITMEKVDGVFKLLGYHFVVKS